MLTGNSLAAGRFFLKGSQKRDTFGERVGLITGQCCPGFLKLTSAEVSGFQGLGKLIF
jgi:hypothetical protein